MDSMFHMSIFMLPMLVRKVKTMDGLEND